MTEAGGMTGEGPAAAAAAMTVGEAAVVVTMTDEGARGSGTADGAAASASRRRSVGPRSRPGTRSERTFPLQGGRMRACTVEGLEPWDQFLCVF